MLYEVPTDCYVLYMSVHIYMYPAKSSAQLSVRVLNGDILSSPGIVVFNVHIE